MRDEQKIAETNRTVDSVIGHGTEFALDWLRGAFHSHESAIDHLLAEFRELAALYLAEVTARPLTVREAQLLNVCRVCRGPDKPNGSPFMLEFGAEYAHDDCLKLGSRFRGENI